MPTAYILFVMICVHLQEVSEIIKLQTAFYTLTAFEQLQYRLIIHSGRLVITILLPVTRGYI